MVLKNLWAKRKETIWLFLELVVITVVTWAVIDPSVVNLYYRSQPMGYDAERLIYAELTAVYNNPDIPDAWEATREHMPTLLNQLRAHDGVEYAYCFENPYMSVYNDQTSFLTLVSERDSIEVADVDFLPDINFFETYGLKPLPGSPAAEELSHLLSASQQVVLSRSAAEALFHTVEKAVGRRLKLLKVDGEPEVTVAGVVENIQHSQYNSIHSAIYRPISSYNLARFLIIRLRRGFDPAAYIEEHGHDILQTAKTRFCRIRRIMPYTEHINRWELATQRPQKVNINLALTLFFLINLSLAVIGTVWLSAKRRTEECGVRRAYGATRTRLLIAFLTEGAILASVAVFIGCIIWLNYAYSDFRIYNGYENFSTMYTADFFIPRADLTWVDHFWSHFLIVSAIVYLIILITVLIGTAIPAIKIIRTRITDALREE